MIANAEQVSQTSKEIWTCYLVLRFNWDGLSFVIEAAHEKT